MLARPFRHLVLALAFIVGLSAHAHAAPLEIREGDHICLIGNTLAERMQFEGHNHFETLLYQRFPKHNLVVRNLAWSADEVALRPRAEGFGSPDDHLKFCKADVIIAFFGFNESFKGEAGLEKFKSDLEDWIKHTKSQDYSGKGPPRIALISPIAAEASPKSSPGLQPAQPGTSSNVTCLPAELATQLNVRLELYSRAIREVAERNGVVFANMIPLVPPPLVTSGTERIFMTINGVHLNRLGDTSLAFHLDQELFGAREYWKHPGQPKFIQDWYAGASAFAGGQVPVGSLTLKKHGTTETRLVRTDGIIDGWKLSASYPGRGLDLDLEITDGTEVARLKLSQISPFHVDDSLRREIESKSLLWYNRYRIVDSYYVYGGRSDLKFADGDQTNRNVMQREREILDVMVANRDARIWQLAQGQTVPEKCDDFNVPPRLSVQTSFGVNQRKDAGANTGLTSKTAEGTSAQIPSVAETLKKFTLAKGFKVECFASEEEFPELANATSMAFDTRGRLWVCTMPSYPQWGPGEQFRDKIIILEDSDGDGKANYCTTFADKLHLPISFEFHDGGILMSDQRNLTFLKDTNGDDKADIKEVVLSGFDSADSHHVINAFTYGPGGDLYFQEGTFHHSQVETPYGPVRCANAGTYRYEPRTGKLSVFVSYNYANPHGIAFDKWGQTFIADASGGMNYFATAFSGFLPYPEKHGAMNTFLTKRVRPTSGCEFVSSRNFPDNMQGNFLLNNCIGVQGTLNHTVKAVGSGYEATEIEPLAINSDPNYRPVDMEFGPDGALYITDWAEALIGHMQYSIRDPLRDQKHGRIWRIWNGEKPLVQPAKIADEPVERLVDLLKEPEQRTRERVKKELSTRPTAEVMKALEKWLGPEAYGRRTATDEAFERRLLEALWVCQWHNEVNERLLNQVLVSGIPEAIPAAVRALCYWQDRVPDAIAFLKTAANDPHPLVRLEAVRACSFFGEDPALTGVPGHGAHRTEAINIALEVLRHEMDYYLTYTLGETMRALKPSPTDIDVKANPAALSYVLGKMTNEELKAAPREAPVLEALLQREGIDAASRELAAADLAKARGTTREKELIQAVFRIDEQNKETTASADLGKLLAMSPPESLKQINDLVVRMGGKDHGVRSARLAGMAAWVAMLGSPESIYTGRKDNHKTLAALFDSAVLISDPALRAKFQPFLFEALHGQIPDHLRQSAMRALPLTGIDHAATNFSLLTEALLKGQERATAAGALMQLPRTSWDKTKAKPVTDSILAYAKSVPVTQRTQQDYVEITQFGSELASLLPEDESKSLRKALRELGVAVFVIKTVREQMRYDTPKITVEAGKPFEVIFENNDIMPHNLVFCRPGTHIEVGTAAQALPAVPDRKGNLYIPEHKAILKNAFTKMLEPGQTQRLQLTAPNAPGEFEYVCTFPGHWTIMWGTLSVVKQLD